MKTNTANKGEEKRVEADVPSTENEMSEVASTTSPESNNPEANLELNTPTNISRQAPSVTYETSNSGLENVQSPGEMAGLPDSKHSTHQFSEEMRQWLTDNREDYEFYLLHATMHDYMWRSTMMALPLLPEDFRREEYALVMGAIINATKVVNLIGGKVVESPPTPEFLRTYLNSAAREEGSDELAIEDAMKLLRELQNPAYTKEHYCVRPYFEAWYGSQRAKKAARRIQMEDVPDVRSSVESIQKALHAASQMDGFLNSRKFDFASRPEEAEALLTFKGHTICTPGNIVNVQGPPKSCKSGIVGAILATALRLYDWRPIDSLGFDANLPLGYAVLHFDTEQSDFDHDRLIRRAYTRADRKKAADWLYSYRFTGMDPSVCWNKMQEAIYEAVNVHKGVSLLIIDGIADFCNDPNDPAECFELVRKLHALSSDYNCGVITVLHQNPGSPNGKTRGHLGSQIERKAETSIRVEKAPKSEIFQAWADSARSCHIPKSEAWRFHWSDEKQMHVTISCSDEELAAQKPDKKEKYSAEVKKAFGEVDVLRNKEFVEQISSVTGLAVSTAKQRLPEYLNLGLIAKDEKGHYHSLV